MTAWHDSTPDLLARHRLSQERRGLRASTIEAYQYELGRLARAIAPRSLLEATGEDVESMCDRRRLGPQARYRLISFVHVFFTWARVQARIVDHDPTDSIIRPRLHRRLPRPIRNDDLAHAIAVAPPLMKAWIALGALAGLRCSEIAGLRREDVLEGAEPPMLIVTEGKGGHERAVPLRPDLLAALRLAGMSTRGGLLWPRPSDGRARRGSDVSAAIGRYLRSIGVEATAHQLRHWFGTNVYEASQDLRVTQELLGHASPTTTTVYVAFSHARAVQAVGALQPPAALLAGDRPLSVVGSGGALS